MAAVVISVMIRITPKVMPVNGRNMVKGMVKSELVTAATITPHASASPRLGFDIHHELQVSLSKRTDLAGASIELLAAHHDLCHHCAIGANISEDD